MSNTTQLNSNENKNKSNKKFAIFITSYNYAEYISQAIESVINQTDPDWHLYIIDDASTDNTEEIVKKYLKKDSRISWKKHQKNIGSVPTIIEGFSEIDADYISTLCSDDWLEPNFVANAKKAFAENPEIPFCALGWSGFMELPENGKILTQKSLTPFPENFCGKIFLSPYLVFENFININFLVFERSKLQNSLKKLENIGLRQYLESFLIIELETQFGASFFNYNSHGYWRRHFQQLTTKNNESGQRYIEKISLPLLLCELNFLHSEHNNYEQKLLVSANNFLSLVSLLGQSQKASYKVVVEWLLSELGKYFAEKVGNLDFEFIKANNLEKSLLCLAVCVWSSFIFNCNNGGWEKNIEVAKKQLGEWILEIQQKYNFRNIKEIYAEANKLYDGYFMPLIK